MSFESISRASTISYCVHHLIFKTILCICEQTVTWKTIKVPIPSTELKELNLMNKADLNELLDLPQE